MKLDPLQVELLTERLGRRSDPHSQQHNAQSSSLGHFGQPCGQMIPLVNYPVARLVPREVAGGAHPRFPQCLYLIGDSRGTKCSYSTF